MGESRRPDTIMKSLNSQDGIRSSRRSPWLWVVGVGGLFVVFLASLLPRPNRNAPVEAAATNASAVDTSWRATVAMSTAGPQQHRATAARAPAPTPEEVVADKLHRFAQSRREFVHALAQKQVIAVPDGVERFFDALEAGDWNEIQARYDAINGGDRSGTTLSPARPGGMGALWPAIFDAYGAAQTAQNWPAQQLLDYGDAVLGSLRPGMVYVGGTEPGRWIPELLNDTSEGERHIIITQNALADPNYLGYVNLMYGEQFAALEAGDGQRAYGDYLADYQKRLAHDQEFPNEPKQVRPGESDGVRVGDDGQLQVYGPKSIVSVMAINEQLLGTLLQRNPSVPFAMEESYSLSSTYVSAAPLGPIVELRASDGRNTLSADSATQSLAWWQAKAQELLANPEVSGSSDTLKTYAHDMASQARLFVSNNLNGPAEQAFQLANEITPANPEVVYGYATLLANQNRLDEARQIVQKAAGLAPDNRPFQSLLSQLSQQK
jgi:tetratricopeptide (TPR) repeat protein